MSHFRLPLLSMFGINQNISQTSFVGNFLYIFRRICPRTKPDDDARYYEYLYVKLNFAIHSHSGRIEEDCEKIVILSCSSIKDEDFAKGKFSFLLRTVAKSSINLCRLRDG